MECRVMLRRIGLDRVEPDHRPDHRRMRRVLARVLLPMVPALLLAGPGSASAAPTPHPAAPSESACERGEFCVWPRDSYHGDGTRFDLRNTNPEECVPLPAGMAARSFANRIDRHVTVYQDRHCSTEGDFTTYPGPETFVPHGPFVVRAIQIWN